MVDPVGMSDRIGLVLFGTSYDHPFLGRVMSVVRDHS